MKSYNTIEDFLQDKSFLSWVLHADTSSGCFWEKMASDKEKGIILHQARLILLEFQATGEDWEEQDQLLLPSSIHQNIQQGKPGRGHSTIKSEHSEKNHWRGISMLLFVIFISMMGFLAFDVVKYHTEPALENTENKPHWITKFNPKGQKSKIHLPDGSTVIINADSEIKYRSDFGVNNREIHLTGESFFEVVPDSLLPFRVFSGKVITTALGTSFNIQSYNPDKIKVQLATGKVEVVNELLENQLVFLQPGEEVTSVGNQKITKSKFNPKKAFSWKSGVLFFDNASLSEFELTLERWYGVEISLENRPKQKLKISGEFKDSYLSNVLESVGYAYGFNHIIDQKKVKLVFEH